MVNPVRDTNLSTGRRKISNGVNIDSHTHTRYSDGLLKPKAMIEKAIEVGISHFGISDHYKKFLAASINSRGEFKRYIDELSRLKEEYSPKIALLIGLEAHILTPKLPFDEINRLDYLLFEDMEHKLDYYLDQIRPNLAVPVGMAHPRIFSLEDSQLNIIEENRIAIEINTHYIDNYRSEAAKDVMKRMRSKEIYFWVASDAHDASRVGDTGDALNFLKENGLIDRLSWPKP